MKSLTSKQIEQLSDLQEKLQSASQRVESAIAQARTQGFALLVRLSLAT